jgi:hypothetical protein
MLLLGRKKVHHETQAKQCCKTNCPHGTNILDLGVFRPPLNCRNTASGPLPSPGKLASMTGLREIPVGGGAFCVGPPLGGGAGAAVYFAGSTLRLLAFMLGI